MQRHDRLDDRAVVVSITPVSRPLPSLAVASKASPRPHWTVRLPFPSVPEICGNVWTPHIYVRPSVVQLTHSPQYVVVQPSRTAHL